MAKSLSHAHDKQSLIPAIGADLFAIVGLPAFPFALSVPAEIPIDQVGPNGAEVTITYGAGDMTTFNLITGQSQTLIRSGNMNTASIDATGRVLTLSSNNPQTGISNITVTAQ